LIVRAPPDRFTEKSFFELLPKRKLLAALSLVVLLLIVLYAQRHAQRGMQQVRGFFGPAPAAQTSAPSEVRRARLAPAPGEPAP
jgi:hypothetical protein